MKFQPLQSLHPSKGRRKQTDLMVRTVGDKIEIEAGNGATGHAQQHALGRDPERSARQSRGRSRPLRIEARMEVLINNCTNVNIIEIFSV